MNSRKMINLLIKSPKPSLEISKVQEFEKLKSSHSSKINRKNKWPCSSQETQITIKGWEDKGKTNKENEEKGR